MNKLKELMNNQYFKRYSILFVLLVLVGVVISTSNITYSKYETNTKVNLKPAIAFFIVDVDNQTQSIKLESMVPSDEPYMYRFDVSNFKDDKKANVDLKYKIELITTTNMPLEFRVFKDPDLSNNIVSNTTYTTDDNGVFYKHLIIDDINPMYFSNKKTDVYYLWVKFPKQYENSPEHYSGNIDLVDIKINAEQVV